MSTENPDQGRVAQLINELVGAKMGADLVREIFAQTPPEVFRELAQKIVTLKAQQMEQAVRESASTNSWGSDPLGLREHMAAETKRVMVAYLEKVGFEARVQAMIDAKLGATLEKSFEDIVRATTTTLQQTVLKTFEDQLHKIRYR